MNNAIFRLGLCALFACAGTAMAQPVTDTSAEHWRAVSRFGYGPAGLQADGVQGKAWALQQLQVATAASRAAPRMPAELASFDEPLPTLFEKFRRQFRLWLQLAGWRGSQRQATAAA